MLSLSSCVSYVRSVLSCFFFFSSRRRHTRFDCDWSSDVCSSDLCHRLWRAVPGRFGLASYSHGAVPQPQECKHPWFGLAPVRSPLLRGSRLLSLPPGNEMFQFPGFASLACAQDDRPCDRPGFPIRKSWDHSLFAAPPGLSQLTTSFVASLCQGIHRAPLRA